MKDSLYLNLVQKLNDLIRVHRSFLENVRREKALLLKSDLESLSEQQKAKEVLILKMKELDSEWLGVAQQLCDQLGLKNDNPRLRELAVHFDREKSEKLIRLADVLNLLVSRGLSLNRHNSDLIEHALTHVSGAIQSIRETFNKNSNYEKKGKKAEATLESSGRLVSKEA